MTRVRLVAFVAVVSLLVASCGGGGEATSASEAEAPAAAPTDEVLEPPTTTIAPLPEETAIPETSVESAETVEDEYGGEAEVPDDLEEPADITGAVFTDPLTIDNEWFPLTPGTQLVYEGATVEDGELLPHRVVFTVTDLTKTIGGLQTIVLWDQDFSDGELVEAELAFFAQDDDGNVWHLGQYPEEYEDGELVDAPAWLHGFEDALAGYAMKARSEAGSSSYSQGWGPSVDWTDRGQVAETGAETCVETGCYEDVLVIAEWALDEPEGGVQLKYYAPGVGSVRVGFGGDDAQQEELELIEATVLDEAGLEDVRQRALELEASAYEVSPGLYGLTEPLTPIGS